MIVLADLAIVYLGSVAINYDVAGTVLAIITPTSLADGVNSTIDTVTERPSSCAMPIVDP